MPSIFQRNLNASALHQATAMSRYIIDTNVLSEIWKNNPDENVSTWMKRHEFFIPSPVIAEIVDGIESDTNEARQVRYRTVLDTILGEATTLDWDAETAFVWGKLRNGRLVKSKPQPLWDSLLDAMAVRYNAVIVSRNASDFRHATVFDPWTGLEHLPGKASA